MDGILLLVTGKTAQNFERTLNNLSHEVIVTEEEHKRVMEILEKNRMALKEHDVLVKDERSD